MGNNTKEHLGRSLPYKAWYGKVLGPGSGWGEKGKEELVVCVCPMSPPASYIKKVVAIPSH